VVVVGLSSLQTGLVDLLGSAFAFIRGMVGVQ
jgi:hypothetical protein